jgi:adenine phosphoribosyltransferase
MEDGMPHLIADTLIRDIPDFPQPGILFRDITPVLANPKAVAEVIEQFANFASLRKPDVVVGIESRGFIFGMPLAMHLNLPFVPVRKAGKLPWKCIKEEYALEYGVNSMEMHSDAIEPGQQALIVDDLLATGGTAAAASRLVKRLGGRVVGCCFLIELKDLKGRDRLSDLDVQTLIAY